MTYRVQSIDVSYGKPDGSNGDELAAARDWASRLLARLENVQRSYAEASAAPHLATEAGESRQLLLAKSVQVVIKALQEMPAFEDSAGMAPLHDLLGALMDLHVGKTSPLLERRDVIAGPTTINTGFVRRHAILCVKIMQMSGMKETPACKHVAAAMRRLGFTGRKKGPFPVSTLTDWVAVLDERDRRFLDKRLTEIRADKGDVLDQRTAEQLVEVYLTHPMMMSKR